jgi:hypothetical protein
VVDWIGHGTYEGLLPRKRPLEYLGARYPVLSRGNRRKRDPAKLRIAARVRTETTLSLKAIAARVHLGTSKGANANLHKWMRASASATPAHPSIPNEKRTFLWVTPARRQEKRKLDLQIIMAGRESQSISERSWTRNPTSCPGLGFK